MEKANVKPLGFLKDGTPVLPVAGGSGDIAPGYQGGGAGAGSAYAIPSQDRLVRKEVALGTIRQQEPPQEHMGLRLLAPFEDVESDDVIFDYTMGLTSGLAPARAEDAEAELAQKDETAGYGRAALMDWAIKDHYRPSDVSRYRELLSVRNLGQNLAFVGRMIDDFDAKLAKDERLRRKKLDNRLEWLIMQSIETGGIAYNDGKIKFAVSFGRPGGNSTTAPTLWNLTTSDPIKNITDIQQAAYDTYGVKLDRAITSRRVLNSIFNSDKFNSANGGNPNPFYTVEGWGPAAAQRRVEQAANITFIEYDAVYRTRAPGSTTIVNNRFLSDNKIYFLPSEADVSALDDGVLGFGKTLTSPHPEGNWTSGYYEWERDTVDPWSHDRGTGIKAFPIFPHLELTYVLTVL